MTAYEIINKGFGVAGECFEDYPDKSLPLIWLNITIAESRDAENLVRKKNGKQLLSETAAVRTLTEDVDMHNDICAIALPYGIASYLAADRQDNYMAVIFRNRFITALQNRAKGDEFTIRDFYGGEI